jgi:aminoglycoside N3'-acetyltransferase
MEEYCAMELTDKKGTILAFSLFIIGLQAHKIIQPHILQGINHKAVLGGLVHGKHFLVDGLGHHNDTILHTLSRVVEIIPYAHLSVGPE